MPVMGEFKAFLLKHNVIALAVAVVIGGAVNKVVTALVSEIIMPIVGVMLPAGSWREAVLTLGKVKLGIGPFTGAMIDFLIVAGVVFVIVRGLVQENRKEAREEPA